jgi:hypothetical protein
MTVYSLAARLLADEVDEAEIRRMAAQSGTSIPRHIGVLRMPDGSTWYGPSYLSPDQVTGKQEGTVFGFTSEVWLADGSDEFEETFARLHPSDEDWDKAEEPAAAESAGTGVGGVRFMVKPTNGPTGHGSNGQAATPPYAILVAKHRL